MFSFYKLIEILDEQGNRIEVEQENKCGDGKICSKWKKKDNSCIPGCSQAGISEGGTCVYFNDEKNRQESCPCFVLKKDEL